MKSPPPRHVDQARLRPHFRQEQPKSRQPPEPWVDDHKRRTDPNRLRAIGLTGHTNNFIRSVAGVGLEYIREAERLAVINAGEDIDIVPVLERQNSRCYLCNTQLSVNTACQEHIIPISRGGTHTRENVAVACRACNSRKSNRYVAFMVASRKPIYLWR